MNQKNIHKRKQHYVPQVYLRGFSLEYEPREKKQDSKKSMIFTYNLIKQKYDSPNAVPISSICYENDLYEVCREDGKFVLENHLENFFAELEKMFGHYRTDLEKKTLRDNIDASNFLTRKEKIFWITYIAIHLLRNKYFLEEAEKEIKGHINSTVSDGTIKNVVRMMSLPFWEKIDPTSKEVQILRMVMEPMCKMRFCVGVDFEKKIITSDKGASVILKDSSADEYAEVIFPITSSICMILLEDENKQQYSNNVLFELTEEEKEYIVENVVLDAYERIYTNHRFSVSEKKYIKEIAKNRKTMKADK
ncbi:DUF4238 domain-containing protein [Eubacterium oxidoreducens]|uniref:DUF4238 domain-containing protein n=1 Tax=Eubacterium oxidoreducens TaxID=1732 RepID=A0A1G6CBH0_EUBOX|nr:DUF4238 domain-containing protein [Eubacterium oxidoreducens]SDB30247.1 Protein of unknown function [Eubacterium oxidoreducens]